MTAELIPLSPGLSVAGRLDRADIEALAQAGVRTIVNNRPDGEDPGQLPAAEARRLAEAHGHRLPPHPDHRGEPDARRCRRLCRDPARGGGAGRRPLPQRHPLGPLVGAGADARGGRPAEPGRRGGAPRHRHRRAAGGRRTAAPARWLTGGRSPGQSPAPRRPDPRQQRWCRGQAAAAAAGTARSRRDRRPATTRRARGKSRTAAECGARPTRRKQDGDRVDDAASGSFQATNSTAAIIRARNRRTISPSASRCRRTRPGMTRTK